MDSTAYASAHTKAANRKEERDIRRRRIVSNLTFIIPVAILTLFVLVSIFAPFLAPHSPTKTSLPNRLLPPFFMEGGKATYLLGTDMVGRDILSRVIYGARVSLSVSLLVIFITALVGTILGIIAGYLGGNVDTILMRTTDTCLAIPGILIALLLAVVLGPSFQTVVLALSVLGWATYARLIRGEALRLREADFVGQARIIGSSALRIMIIHIFPNVVNPLIVIATMSVGLVILAEAALSYLGAGIPPTTPTWGSMVSDGRNLIDRAWWISFFPGLAIGLVVMSVNFLGDWMRDKLDPRLRRL
jgi:peptide/nickel transport system permease protein